ncbi:hypothetical protein [Nocardia vinacea]|nr:hypothetical protein [Nocardia vinacea]
MSEVSDSPGALGFPPHLRGSMVSAAELFDQSTVESVVTAMTTALEAM